MNLSRHLACTASIFCATVLLLAAQDTAPVNPGPSDPPPPAPILDGYRADPDIRVFGDAYYIYPTSDKPLWNTTDFSCWSSKDLIHWKNEGIILDVAHHLSWANIKAWAPTATMRDGKYYFYFVANGQIGVATSTSPTGPFTDALGHPLIGKNDVPKTYPIDPDVFIDDDGQAYLYYGNGHLVAAKLNSDMISLDGAPVEITPQDKADPFREGIFVLKRKGLYYFMWSVDMYGVDMSKPGAQDYYNSEFQQFADWGVDLVKIDDLSRPYHGPEIEAIRKAIDKTGRPMVFSTSPGETPLDQASHISQHANMWRISDDFWDNWKSLMHQVDLTAKWAPWTGGGHYPDADMLPLGMIRQGKSKTRFTPDEQVTLMTLWSIFRSPLIFGGDLMKMDDFTLSLITNDEVLAVDQHSSNNRQLFRNHGQMAWVADVPNGSDKYLAIFNLADKGSSPDSGVAVPVKLSDLGLSGSCQIRDLWQHHDLASVQDTFAPALPWHGAGLYRVHAEK